MTANLQAATEFATLISKMYKGAVNFVDEDNLARAFLDLKEALQSAQALAKEDHASMLAALGESIKLREELADEKAMRANNIWCCDQAEKALKEERKAREEVQKDDLDLIEGLIKRAEAVEQQTRMDTECIERLRRVGMEAEQRLKLIERDLLQATSIGIAIIIARVGAYETLTPYLKGKYDLLQSLHAKCDRAFNETAAAQAQDQMPVNTSPEPAPHAVYREGVGFIRDETRGKAIMSPLAQFGLAVLKESRDELQDLDGGWIQNKAEEFGLLVRHHVIEPCGEQCRCDDFPGDCLRYSPEAEAAIRPVVPIDRAPQGGKGSS